MRLAFMLRISSNIGKHSKHVVVKKKIDNKIVCVTK